MPEFSDHRIGDRAVSFVGGNATLFVYDDASQQFVRRTTNVKKENGDRAVGTQLAADHPGQALLRRGDAYKGPAILFGRRFYTAYQPVFNSTGKVIGVVYVGIATQSIAKGVQAAASGTLEVAENIERVARGADETETTSSQMLESARALSEVSIHLRDEVEKFLDSVRAA